MLIYRKSKVYEYQFERLEEEDEFKGRRAVDHEEAMGLLKLALMSSAHEQGVRHH